jgi:hypothetical protein
MQHDNDDLVDVHAVVVVVVVVVVLHDLSHGSLPAATRRHQKLVLGRPYARGTRWLWGRGGQHIHVLKEERDVVIGLDGRAQVEQFLMLLSQPSLFRMTAHDTNYDDD